MNSFKNKTALQAQIATSPTSRHVKKLRAIELLTEFEEKCIFARSRIEKATKLQELGVDMSILLGLSLGAHYEASVSEFAARSKQGSFHVSLPFDPLGEIEIYLVELGLSADATSLKASYEFAWDSLDRVLRASARGLFEAAKGAGAEPPEQIREILEVISEVPIEQLAEIAANWTMVIRKTRELRSILQVPLESSQLPECATSTVDERVTPKKLLFGWPDILKALGRRSDEKTMVIRLNESTALPGPIRIGRQGEKPRVELSELLAWWNKLDENYGASENRKQDREVTVSAQYRHGQHGIVVPDIAGHVRPRRGRPK